MLTSEVRTWIMNCLDYMEQSHSSAAATLTEVKELMPVIPISAFRLLLQALLQPIIKVKGWCVQCISKMPERKGFSFLEMLPNAKEAHNLLQAVNIFAAVLTFSVKEHGVKSSICRILSVFDVPVKQLHQAVKGVKYESGSQKKRHKSATTEVTPERFKCKQEDSDTLDINSSSSSDDEGASARKCKMDKKSRRSSSKWLGDTLSLNTRPLT